MINEATAMFVFNRTALFEMNQTGAFVEDFDIFDGFPFN